jgi:hypothetical protein
MANDEDRNVQAPEPQEEPEVIHAELDQGPHLASHQQEEGDLQEQEQAEQDPQMPRTTLKRKHSGVKPMLPKKKKRKIMVHHST